MTINRSHSPARSLGITLVAVVSALVLALGSPLSASAATVNSARIGSSTAVVVPVNYVAASGNRTFYVTSNLTGHTAGSVKLTSIRVCYNGPANEVAYVRPYTRTPNIQVSWDSKYATQMFPNTCHTWSPINVTYYASAGAEAYRVVLLIVDTGNAVLVAQYLR